jgi:transcriptional regulator with XRE-family HTH domain
VPQVAGSEPRTWGEHLRRQRILRGLLQREIANEIGVSVETIIHWETGKTEPRVQYIPALIQFLGYSLWEAARRPGERFRQMRFALGLTQKVAARLLSVDPATVARWETGERRLPAGYRDRLLTPYRNRMRGR